MYLFLARLYPNTKNHDIVLSVAQGSFIAFDIYVWTSDLAFWFYYSIKLTVFIQFQLGDSLQENIDFTTNIHRKIMIFSDPTRNHNILL